MGQFYQERSENAYSDEMVIELALEEEQKFFRVGERAFQREELTRYKIAWSV